MVVAGGEPLTLRQVAAAAGMSEAAVRNWRHLGLLPPASVDRATGGGRPALYGVREVATAVVLGICSRQGVGRARLLAVARQLRVELEDARVEERGFDGVVVVDVAGATVQLVDRGGDLASAIDGGAVVAPLQVRTGV